MYTAVRYNLHSDVWVRALEYYIQPYLGYGVGALAMRSVLLGPEERAGAVYSQYGMNYECC